MFSTAEIKERLLINMRTENQDCVCRRGISALSCFLYSAKFEVCIFEAKQAPGPNVIQLNSFYYD